MTDRGRFDPDPSRTPPAVIRIDVHHYHHQDEDAGSVTRKLDTLLTQLGAVTAQEQTQMATVQELNAKIDALKVSVDAETDLSTSIVTFLQGEGSLIADLKKQLADALAAGGDQSAALQTAIDTLGVIETTNTANAKTIADAMIASTPAE